SLMGKAAIANAKVAYRDFEATFGDARFQALEARGARVQRPLWASTSTKNPDYSDVLYVDELIGPHTVNTMPDATLAAYLDHGSPAVTIGDWLDKALVNTERLEDLGISMDKVTSTLLEDGVKSFADSYDLLVANIEEKRAKLLVEGDVVRLGD
ncbi:MAG: transaldolase, partial [Chloroflexi bacterium]|nr:transaldolase [Chloroflexota bacterium]